MNGKELGANLIAGYRRQVEFIPQQVDCFGQVGNCVDQGTVEIEEESVNGHVKTGGAR